MHLNYCKEFKQNIRIAMPIIIGQVGHVLMGFADNLMVGKLGAAAIATISLANSLFFVGMSIGIGFSLSIAPQIATAKSSDNPNVTGKLFLHAKILSLLLGIFICTGLLICRPFIAFLGQPPEVTSGISPYYEIISFSIIPLLFFQCYKQFADGLSFTIYAMRISLLGNLLNVFCNYLLIYGNWSFPELGVAGAGWGTFISRIFMCFLMLITVHKNTVFKSFLSRIRWGYILKDTLFKMLKMGYATALQMLFEVSIFAATILMAGKIGVQAQAVNQIGLNLATMTFMVFSAMGITASIRIGHYKGQKNKAMIKTVARSIILQVLVWDVFFATVFLGFKNWLPALYINDPKIIYETAKILIIAAFFQFADSMQVVLLGILRGMQDVIRPIWITFFGYGLVGFPVCFFLGIRTSLGVQGIWLGILIALTTVALLLYKRFQKVLCLTLYI